MSLTLLVLLAVLFKLFIEFVFHSQVILSVRQEIINLFFSEFPKDVAAFYLGILIGDDSKLANNIYQDFSDSGLTHILAVSGFNINLVYVLIKKLLQRISNKYITTFISSIVLFLYLALIGYGNVPALRAFIMIMLVIFAKLLGRVINIYSYIYISLIFVLLVYPDSILKPSLYLSYLATMGIIIITGQSEGLFSDLKASLVVITYTSIITIFFFSQANLNGLIGNLLIIPFISPMTKIGFVYLFFPFVRLYFNPILHYLIHLILYLNNNIQFLNLNFIIYSNHAYLLSMAIAFFLITNLFVNYRNYQLCKNL